MSDCPICTDADDLSVPMCDVCWSEVVELRTVLAESGYEVSRDEMTQIWGSQMALENSLYDDQPPDESHENSWRAALNIHVFRNPERQVS